MVLAVIATGLEKLTCCHPEAVSFENLADDGAILGCAGVDGRPSGVLPMTNRFTASRTGQTSVLWLRFQSQKGNSGLKLLRTSFPG